jgi:hypothetical protein
MKVNDQFQVLADLFPGKKSQGELDWAQCTWREKSLFFQESHPEVSNRSRSLTFRSLEGDSICVTIIRRQKSVAGRNPYANKLSL